MSKDLTLKNFVELIRNYCCDLSQEELIEMIIKLGTAVSVKERSTFLNSLNIPLKDDIKENNSVNITINKDIDEILNNIEILAEEILERQDKIESGDYYEENNDCSCHYDYDYYDDEYEAEMLSEEQIEEIEKIYSLADKLFLANAFKLALKIYDSLLSTFFNGSYKEDDKDENYLDLYYSDIKINWQETFARHCSTIYKAYSAKDMVEKFYFVMSHAQEEYYHYDPSNDKTPSLKDIFNANIEELENWPDFLQQIMKYLEKDNSIHGFLTYIEAFSWTFGIDKLSSLVYERKSPVGYCYLLDLLETEKKYLELGETSIEALKNVDKKHKFRVYIIEQMIVAAEKTNNNLLLLTGKEEKLFCSTNDENFLILIDEANKQDVKNKELEKVLDFLNSNEIYGAKTLNIKVLLIMKELYKAYSVIDKTKAVGWSYSRVALVYSAILMTLVKNDSKAIIIHDIFEDYSGEILLKHISESLSSIIITESEKKEYLNFIATIADLRIKHIVSNQHRKAYKRAAETMCSYLEYLVLDNKIQEAKNFYYRQLKVNFPRHRAFHTEVASVMYRTKILRGIDHG